MKSLIFIDTDMGMDDIIAICLLVLSKKYTISGLTIVNGVADVQSGTKNAQRLLKALNINAPVFTGISQAQQGSSQQFPSLDRSHANGLALLTSVELPKISPSSLSMDNIESIFETQKLTSIFCLGPLSNMALMVEKKSIKRKIKRLIIMGGAIYTKGNVRPSFTSEYNIHLDVRSAEKIFVSDIPKTVIPVDATRYTPALLTINTPAQSKILLQNFLAWLKNFTPPTRAGKIIRDIILNNSDDFSYFYDPLAALLIIDPSIIATQIAGDVSVSKNKKEFAKTQLSANINSSTSVVLSVNSARFYALLKKLLQQDDKK